MAIIKKTSATASKTSSKSSMDDSRLNQMIKEKAYYIWESMGKPDGKDFEIWVKAEKEISKSFKR